MKRFKLLFVFALFSSLVVSMTSCLSNDDNSSSTGYAIMQVSSTLGSIVLKTGDLTIYPSSTSLSTVETNYSFKATSGMAFVYYSYDINSTENKNYKTTKVLYVDLLAAYSLDNTVEEPQTKGASNDSTSTASIIGLNSPNGNAYGYYTYTDGTSTYLVTGINYFLTESTADTHYFTLVYYPKDTESGDNTLNVYLHHRSTDTTGVYLSSSAVDYVPSFYYKSFNITQILADFAEKSGTTAPAKIVIHTTENQETGSLTDSNDNTYSLEYKTVS